MAKKEDGSPVYSLATGVSLMVFYVFAMQCMATLAVVKKETKSWRWPLLQLVIMGAMAYLGALISYQLLA
jgi:ferrous iron transport protein B